MAKTPLRQISRIVADEADEKLIQVDKIDVPHTQIKNRAKIIDLSKDMAVNFGINRIHTQQIFKKLEEHGPNDEQVWGVENDKFDQIRFVGYWENENGLQGAEVIQENSTTDYVEITFYGTGLNIMVYFDGASRDYRYSVDGGAESGNIYPSGGDGIMNGRFYEHNQIIPVVSGLTLGIHTVKIRSANTFSFNIRVNGFEVLNESSQLQVNEGYTYIDGLKVNHAAEAVGYNSDFENEYGTAGAKGGAVILYIDDQGNVKKDIQYTDVNPLYLENADHSNEEEIRRHFFREFGQGRADDLSTMPLTGGDDTFALHDGTTSMWTNDGAASTIYDVEGIFLSDNNDFACITFVGTGLDMFYTRDDGNSTADIEVLIDGVSQGSLNNSILAGGPLRVTLCSGLPYGTHTVKIRNNSSGAQDPTFSSFMVYAPKKPTLPENCVELSSYYLMADYQAPAGSQDNTDMPQGVIFKSAQREFLYYGSGWSFILDNAKINGNTVSTSTSSDYFEYTFFGTGFVLLESFSTTNNCTLTLDGSSDFSSYTFNTYGGGNGSFTPATGVYVGQDGSNNMLAITGLDLGLHTIRVTSNNSSSMGINGIGIVTPVHHAKDNGPVAIQNTLPIGSCALSDSRNVKGVEVGRNRGYSLAYNDNTTRADLTVRPIPGISPVTIKTSGKPVRVSIRISTDNSGGSGSFQAQFFLRVNGEYYRDTASIIFEESDTSVTGSNKSKTFTSLISLDAGYHTFVIYWACTANADLRMAGARPEIQYEEIA